MNPVICPKCQYRRRAVDDHVHADVCPACGISYSKWQAKYQSSGSSEPASSGSPRNDIVIFSDDQFSRQQLIQMLMYVPEKTDATTWWARAALWVMFVVWGMYFIHGGVDWEVVGGSFMHAVNLPFHEFGHVLFSPFGRFLTILGGSLFQVLLPLMLGGVFVFQQRDNFAASITLWWCGQSFIDLAPYIDDAKARAIPLVGGRGEEAHDWGNLLTMFNAVEHAHGIARFSFLMGTGFMILAWVWGATLLRQQRKFLAEV